MAAQVALSFLLLFGAGLFVQSLQNLKGTDTGVALDNLVTFQLSPALSGYDDASHRPRSTRSCRIACARRPASCRSAWATVPILSGDEWDSTMSVEGHQANDGEDMQALHEHAVAGLLHHHEDPAARGPRLPAAATRQKEAARGDRQSSRFAEHFFPGQSAVGRHLGFGDRPGIKLEIEIVGVAANSLYEGPREGVRRQVFIPNWGNNGATFYVRTQSASASAFTQIRGELRALDAGIPVYAMKTVEGQLDETLLTDRLIAMLSAGFGLLATVLASVGLYGVMAFVVARRRKEMGLRLALGADPGQVDLAGDEGSADCCSASASPSAAGGRSALGRLVSRSSMASSQTTRGWPSRTMRCWRLVSAAAGFIPARRASLIDPNLALRNE